MVAWSWWVYSCGRYVSCNILLIYPTINASSCFQYMSKFLLLLCFFYSNFSYNCDIHVSIHSSTSSYSNMEMPINDGDGRRTFTNMSDKRVVFCWDSIVNNNDNINLRHGAIGFLLRLLLHITFRIFNFHLECNETKNVLHRCFTNFRKHIKSNELDRTKFAPRH